MGGVSCICLEPPRQLFFLGSFSFSCFLNCVFFMFFLGVSCVFFLVVLVFPCWHFWFVSENGSTMLDYSLARNGWWKVAGDPIKPWDFLEDFYVWPYSKVLWCVYLFVFSRFLKPIPETKLEKSCVG